MRLTFFLCLIALYSQAQKPELILPAIHAKPISDVCFSADNRFMATCADKEIKLWELKTGRLIRTIKTPLPVAQISLTNDGSQLALGTFCGTTSYLEDQGYKPDINTEVQLWDMVSGKKMRTIKAFGKPICIFDVEISGDGRFVLANYDGKVTCWNAISGAEIHQLEIPSLLRLRFSTDASHYMVDTGDKAVYWVDTQTGTKELVVEENCLEFTSNGDMVQVLTEGGILKQWNWREKKFLPDLRPEFQGDISIVFSPSFFFSNDGEQLAALYELEDGQLFYQKIKTQTGEVLARQIWPHEHKNWVFLSPDLQHYIESPMVDVADVRAGMTAYSLTTGQYAYSFGLKVLEATTQANAWDPPEFRVYNGGRMIFVKRDYEKSTGMPNLLFLPERGEAICGVESDSVKLYAENQTLTEDKRWRLECKDGVSYQLSDAKTGKLVATLLVADVWNEEDVYKPSISRIWAVSTPSGLFDASPEMMENLHYVTGMEVIELSQLKERYYEPGLLGKLMGFSKSELRSVEAFNNVALYPEISATIDKNQLQITLTERGGDLGKLSLFVNGKQMNADVNPGRQKTLSLNLDEYAAQYRADVPSTIGLVAYNAGDWLKSQAFELQYKPVGSKGDNTTGAPKPSECGAAKPSLFLLMIGTSKYNDASKNLTYPDLDAAEMAKALNSTGKILFGDKVELKLLTTAGEGVEVPSKANIEKAFKEYAQKATPCDVLVVYFSGHGSTWGKEGDKTNFYYLTKDITSAKLADDAVRKEYAVSDEDLTKWLAAIPAQKQVLILDACNSGKAAETFSGIGQRDLNSSQVIAFELMKDRTGTFILTGSAADMVSFEASQYGQGLLTYSLLQGISGTALKDGKYVDIMTLFQNSRDVVPKLAASIKQVQTPVIAAPKSASSFPIGIKDASVKINLPQPKPVVIRCNFQDRDNYNDGLGLTQAMNDYFHSQTAKGVQAKYVYYDIPKFDEGYAIRGNYAIKGEQVDVAGRLFKGETPVGAAFQLTGDKNPDSLVKLILKEVGPAIK